MVPKNTNHANSLHKKQRKGPITIKKTDTTILKLSKKQSSSTDDFTELYQTLKKFNSNPIPLLPEYRRQFPIHLPWQEKKIRWTKYKENMD